MSLVADSSTPAKPEGPVDWLMKLPRVPVMSIVPVFWDVWNSTDTDPFGFGAQ